MNPLPPPGAARPSTAKQVLSWIWAFAPLWSLGYLTAPFMIVAAVRVRRWYQYVLSLGFVAAVVAMVATAGPTQTDSEALIFGVGFAVNTLVGLTNALAVREKAFFRGRKYAGPAPGPWPVSALEQQELALEQAATATEVRKRARELVETDPKQAIELLVGRVDVPHRMFPDGGLIDVNNVPWQMTVIKLPVLSPHAEKLKLGLDEVRQFSSVEQLSITVGLPANLLDPVADQLVFLPRYTA